MAISDMRREYRLGVLDRADLASDPVSQFQRWFDAASSKGGGRLRRFCVDVYKAFHSLVTGSSFEANSMVLATAGHDGQPSARVVLLKGVDGRGFTFFTNYQSRKGRELADNPRAAAVFYWPDLERQVCIMGSVTPLSREESEEYFHSRPRGSQIGTWASDQSAVVADRAELVAKFRQIEARFAGKDIAIPPQWGGYVLKPERIEFWQGRPSRMHDRFCYTRIAENQWSIDRLSP
jgi:pyridoxamine 5'-phosphate oxidase